MTKKTSKKIEDDSNEFVEVVEEKELKLRDKIEVVVVKALKNIPPFRYIYANFNVMSLNMTNAFISINSISEAVMILSDEIGQLRQSHFHVLEQLSGKSKVDFPKMTYSEKVKDEDKPN